MTPYEPEDPLEGPVDPRLAKLWAEIELDRHAARELIRGNMWTKMVPAEDKKDGYTFYTSTPKTKTDRLMGGVVPFGPAPLDACKKEADKE